MDPSTLRVRGQLCDPLADFVGWGLVLAFGKCLPNRLPLVVMALILRPHGSPEGLLWASYIGEAGRARARQVYGPHPCPQLCSQMLAMGEWEGDCGLRPPALSQASWPHHMDGSLPSPRWVVLGRSAPGPPQYPLLPCLS